MKRNLLKIVAGVGLLALIPTAAMAHSDISIGLNLGGGYYAPAPVYAAPAPVYYGPAPSPYYAPTVVYGEGYHDGDRWRHRQWEEHRWHEEHEHEDHGWRDHGDDRR